MNTGITGPYSLYVNALLLSPGYITDHTLFAGTDGSSVWQYTLLRPYNLYLPLVLKGYGLRE